MRGFASSWPRDGRTPQGAPKGPFLGMALLPHVGSPGLTRPFCQLIIGGPDVVAVVISGGGTELE